MESSEIAIVGDWFDLCHRAGIGLSAATEMGGQITEAYGAPSRRYHRIDHVGYCLALLVDVPLEPGDRMVVEFAVWFHDVVYDPTRTDNEARSAEMAVRWFEGLGPDPCALTPENIAQVVNLIEMTAKHEIRGGADLAAQALHDVDLAILGSAPDNYDQYRDLIRAEYSHVEDDDFRVGRMAMLQSLGARDPLFALPAFRVRFEQAARDNIERELSQLGDSD